MCLSICWHRLTAVRTNAPIEAQADQDIGKNTPLNRVALIYEKIRVNQQVMVNAAFTDHLATVLLHSLKVILV